MRAFLVALTLAILLAGCATEQAAPPEGTDAPADPAPTVATADPAPRREEPVVPNPDPGQETHEVALATGLPLTIVAPAAWTFSAGQMGAELVLLAPLDGPNDAFRENVNLLIQQVGEMTMEEYDQVTMEGIATMVEGGAVTGFEDATFAGRDATRIEYAGRIGELDGEWIAWYFLEDGFAYVFTYTAQAGHAERELAEAMADSVTIG